MDDVTKHGLKVIDVIELIYNQEIVICGDCGNEIPSDARYCKYCAKPQQDGLSDHEARMDCKKISNNYHALIWSATQIQESGALFCSRCGEKLNPDEGGQP